MTSRDRERPFLVLGLFLLAAHAEVLALERRAHSGDHCETEEYYRVRRELCCRNCPAGTYVTQHCLKDQEKAKCASCMEGFTAFENGLIRCITCTVCRDDQEQVSACIASKDAVCQCGEGRYCMVNQPCEICHSCKSRCPDGESVKINCTPTSNTVCAKVTLNEDPPQISGGMLALVIVLPIILGLVLGLAGRCLWKKYPQFQQIGIYSKICRHWHTGDSPDPENGTVQGAVVNDSRSGTGGEGGTSLDASGHNVDNDDEQVQTEEMSLLQKLPGASPEHGAGTCVQGTGQGGIVDLPLDQGDNSLIGQNGVDGSGHPACVLNITSPCSCGAMGNEKSGARHWRCPAGNTPSVSHVDTVANRHHCLHNKAMDIEDLRQSFMFFIEEVPIKKWKQFMRKLDLTENEIETAEQNNSKNIEEAHYQMLNTWLQKAGHTASHNTLLNILKDMELNDAAGNIKAKTNETEL
ncbi:tumor necrosis factor receptor superfamily member 10B-like [Rhinoraja longicauda]